MLGRIRAFLRGGQGLSREQLQAVRRLPAADRPALLGTLLHDRCVETAARFVTEQRQQPGSPYACLPEAELFHELLMLNFWILESLFEKRRAPVMDQVYREYRASFIWGRDSAPGELPDAMRTRFRTYDASWDDYSGHQDVFARQAIGIIFAGRTIDDEPHAAFWLISHADRSMKEFAAVRTSVDSLLGT